MSSLAISQERYRTHKIEQGWKRVQIWKLDETNPHVKARIKRAAAFIQQSEHEMDLLKDIKKYNKKMLDKLPL